MLAGVPVAGLAAGLFLVHFILLAGKVVEGAFGNCVEGHCMTARFGQLRCGGREWIPVPAYASTGSSREQGLAELGVGGGDWCLREGEGVRAVVGVGFIRFRGIRFLDLMRGSDSLGKSNRCLK